MKKPLTIALICLAIGVTGCRQVDDFETKVNLYTQMAKEQAELSIDASNSGDYAEMVRHQAKVQYYSSQAHAYKDSIFNTQYRTK